MTYELSARSGVRRRKRGNALASEGGERLTAGGETALKTVVLLPADPARDCRN